MIDCKMCGKTVKPYDERFHYQSPLIGLTEAMLIIINECDKLCLKVSYIESMKSVHQLQLYAGMFHGIGTLSTCFTDGVHSSNCFSFVREFVSNLDVTSVIEC